MSYSPSGNILQKTLTALTSINGVNINIDKDYSYSYNSAKPHAVTNVFSFAYGYDANGNMTSDCPTRTCRTQAWDEENRLTTVNDKNKSYLSNYLYDAGGERIIKLSGAIQKITQQNGDIIEFANLGENISINFGAHMVLNNNRYTKHYYIEGQRICSKLGKGFSAPPVGITQSVTPISGTYTNIANKVLVMLHRGDRKAGFDTLNTTYPASITIVPNSTAAETDRYFYHSDHLGSSSFISNNAGTTTQHLQYLPFGESFVEQKSTTAYLSPYRYSGKEKDEETGYSYFGARYYNPELSVWLSVDPMAEKYPSTSAYAYVENNPIIFIDPDGNRKWPVNKEYVKNNSNYTRGISSGFYRNQNPNIKHGGLDIGFAKFKNDLQISKQVEGATVYATHGGTVSVKYEEGGFGNYVVVTNDNIRTIYGHLKEVPSLVNGQKIGENDEIGIIGSTGLSTGNHLHYQIEIQDENGKWNKINPVSDERKQVKTFTEDVDLVDPQQMINERDKPIIVEPQVTTNYKVETTNGEN